MKFIVFFTLLGSSVSFAAKIDSKECQDKLSNKQLEMDVIASNIANINTTRTPEGGPYNKKELLCKNKNCKIIAHAYFITKYQPDHIDAGDSGYVKFPNIIIEEEISAMLAATHDYEKIITDCK